MHPPLSQEAVIVIITWTKQVFQGTGSSHTRRELWVDNRQFHRKCRRRLKLHTVTIVWATESSKHKLSVAWLLKILRHVVARKGWDNLLPRPVKHEFNVVVRTAEKS